MRRVFVFVLVAIVLAPAVVAAQTVNRNLEWDHLADTLARVNGYVFTLKIDAAAATAITPQCQTAGADVHCKTPITLTPGNHTIVVSATNANTTSSGTLNYVPPPAPSTPVNITITISITVP